MGQYRQHVFICTNGPYCSFDGDSEGLLKRLKQRVAEAGLTAEVRINRAGCLNQCGHGINLVVYPEDVWYCGAQASDADAIFEQHIVGGKPVERLVNRMPPGDNKDTEAYPAEIKQFKQVDKRLDAQRREEVARIKAHLAAASAPNEFGA
ncbi:MAG: (2Fe-2S) ferredoxin domain-containing protein [Anaerolineae bacterium]